VLHGSLAQQPTKVDSVAQAYHDESESAGQENWTGSALIERDIGNGEEEMDRESRIEYSESR
jgi:hypothetical protein